MSLGFLCGYVLATARNVARYVVPRCARTPYRSYAASTSPLESRISSHSASMSISEAHGLRQDSAYLMASAFLPIATSAFTAHRLYGQIVRSPATRPRHTCSSRYAWFEQAAVCSLYRRECPAAFVLANVAAAH